MSIKYHSLLFPRNFAWGFATAAVQIEGAAFTDGKGESIWDRFARIPGAIKNGHLPDVACDHYTRYPEDFALMRSLGTKNYRFSLSWPRIFPNGDGAINQKGLAFYHRLLDSLEENGITPWVTMYHWDLPQALETRFGGWRNRRIVEHFARYADTIVQAYGERVKNWITLNEIQCFTNLGYGAGLQAPGLRLSQQMVNQTYHHALLCHGQGVRAVREYGGKGARVGLTDNSNATVPFTETEADIAAAREQFRCENWKIIDAIYRCGYDPRYLESAGENAPQFEGNDFRLISSPTDFLGMNIYTGNFVRASESGAAECLPFPDSFPKPDSIWQNIMPQVMYWAPRYVVENYGVKSIYITENGCGYKELPAVTGEVNDLQRREFLRNYLCELHRCMQDGVPVEGYFLWSFLDNYEWQDGYDMRFGVVHCNFQTQQRTPKLSAKWFAQVMKENRIV